MTRHSDVTPSASIVPCTGATFIEGVRVMKVKVRRDERGSFQRTYCAEDLAQIGVTPSFAQQNAAWTRSKGTIRGLHMQTGTAAEGKLIQVLRGAIHDVAVDARPGSSTYGEVGHWRLDDREGKMIYLPPGLVHGYQTLEDETLVLYHTTQPYTPLAERVLRWDDEALNITWPIQRPLLSEKDRNGMGWEQFVASC